MKKLFLLFFSLFTIFAQAQSKKIEKEDRINREQMPDATAFLIEKIPENVRRLKFYYETDGQRQSFEAKFKYKNAIFSVEFSKGGELQDIEVTLDDEQLPKISLRNIHTYLEENKQRYKIEKIQAQYLPTSPDHKTIENLLLKVFSFNYKPDNYEIIVAVKNKGKLKRFEMLFNKQGQIKNEREILRNSYDYLIF